MSTQTILVVEDEPRTARALQLSLAACGYTVIEASNGATALQLALEGRPGLALIALDLAGPGAGLGLAQALQAEVDLPVVLLAGPADEALCRGAGGARPYGYLLRPYDDRALRDAVELGLLRHEREGRRPGCAGRRGPAPACPGHLAEAEHLERLRLLSASAAHDLNNMLTALGGQIELAQLDLDDRAAIVASLSEMQGIIRRAADLARSLLAYGSPRSARHQLLDLNTLIGETLTALLPAQLRLCSVETQPAPIPMIEGNATQIQQIVLNLLINAAEAVGQIAGSISVSTGLRLLSEPQLFAGGITLSAGEYVAVEVRDNGVGMDEQTRGQIFEPCFSTKPAGHGLGLAAALEHARAHNGAIVVESAPGSGTLMTVLLPARIGPRPAASL